MHVHSEQERIAAVLHYVIEDSHVTIEGLATTGFTDNVLEAVEALTKRPGESPIEAARRAAANPVARQVKLADKTENSA